MRFIFNLSNDELYKNLNYTEHNNLDSGIDDVIYELGRDGSWLSLDKYYNHIRNLALEDKIAIFCEDVKSVNIFKRIGNILKENDMYIDTLYLTNIKNFMSSNDILLYRKTISYLCDNETLLIEVDEKLKITINNIQFV